MAKKSVEPLGIRTYRWLIDTAGLPGLGMPAALPFSRELEQRSSL
jgi:hypothetical protein